MLAATPTPRPATGGSGPRPSPPTTTPIRWSRAHPQAGLRPGHRRHGGGVPGLRTPGTGLRLPARRAAGEPAAHQGLGPSFGADQLRSQGRGQPRPALRLPAGAPRRRGRPGAGWDRRHLPGARRRDPRLLHRHRIHGHRPSGPDRAGRELEGGRGRLHRDGRPPAGQSVGRPDRPGAPGGRDRRAHGAGRLQAGDGCGRRLPGRRRADGADPEHRRLDHDDGEPGGGGWSGP